MHGKKDIACRLLPLSVVVPKKIRVPVCPDRKLCFVRGVANKVDVFRLSWLFVKQGRGSEYYRSCDTKRLQVNRRPLCPGNVFLTLPRNQCGEEAPFVSESLLAK